MRRRRETEELIQSPQPPPSVRTGESSTIAGELSRRSSPFAFLFSSLLSLLSPVSSLRREWRDKSPPPSRFSNQRKIVALSLPQLLQPASSKQSATATGKESNNISGQHQQHFRPTDPDLDPLPFSFLSRLGFHNIILNFFQFEH
ncbi:hypothetical protein H5410_007652 [Solanum commersonii]|uniref:Uncharacterized protein n=1 Tax=Solanum commersonii TaxID=4109 RepID=A0A9J6AE73_SOLCO|nr:hypothetical protein H5410_007652 [Solanum commersonii]